jgi:hypothetical protein
MLLSTAMCALCLRRPRAWQNAQQSSAHRRLVHCSETRRLAESGSSDASTVHVVEARRLHEMHGLQKSRSAQHCIVEPSLHERDMHSRGLLQHDQQHGQLIVRLQLPVLDAQHCSSCHHQRGLQPGDDSELACACSLCVCSDTAS